MIATFEPCTLAGRVDAPPSKSMAHRYLIGAALSGETCVLRGVDLSEDIAASIDCLRSLGAQVTVDGDRVEVDPRGFMQVENPVLECRESGSTLRFFLPLALCLGKPVTLRGSRRLMERPLDVYEDLCRAKGFEFARGEDSITVCGALESGNYEVDGGISSQFITGLVFALVYLGGESSISIVPPFESRSYVGLTVSALKSFGANVEFAGDLRLEVGKSQMCAFSGRIEGDWSNAAFLDAFNQLGSSVSVGNLNLESLQGDRIYREYFDLLNEGTPTLDVSDCPDLAPILIALAALKNGATLVGTDRLKAKESDRGAAMHDELRKCGGGLVFSDNQIIVPKQELRNESIASSGNTEGVILSGHNDHRIVMAMSVILSQIGGSIDGAEAVRKSYPGFFDDIKQLGAKVELR